MRPDTLRIITQPEHEPVTLSEAKAQLGVVESFEEHDSLILGMIAAGRRFIEKRLGQTLMETQYRASWAEVPSSGSLVLPYPPYLADADHPLVVMVAGLAVAGVDLEVDADAMPATVSLPSGVAGKVVATYWGGATDRAAIDPQVRAALLMYVEHAFKNRGILAEDSAVELPQGFEALLASASHSGGW